MPDRQVINVRAAVFERGSVICSVKCGGSSAKRIRMFWANRKSGVKWKQHRALVML